MALKLQKPQKRPRYPSPVRQGFGYILTLLTVVGCEAIFRQADPSYNPGGLFLLTLIFVTYWSGLRTGMISMGITLLYFLIHYSLPGHLFSYPPGILGGLLFATICYLVFLLPIGIVQNRMRNAGIREFDARQAAELESEGRLRAEDSLRSSEEMWRLVVDASLDAIVVMGEDGRISLWNRYAETLFGWTAPEATGQLLSDLVIPPAYRQAHTEGFQRYLETGHENIFGKRLELTALAKDGHEFPVELSVVPHWTEDGVVFVGFVRDMTEQVKLNERLRQAQKMEAVGTLAAGIAHDFNNILASISGNLVLAKGDLPAGHPAQRSHMEIEKAVGRAANVVRQILTFSSPKNVGAESVDLGATLRDAVNLLSKAIPATVQIETSIESDLPPIVADSTDIHQIVLNLGINAHHAMHGRPGRLDIRAERVFLSEPEAEALVTVSPGAYARLTVRDDGAGMDAATLQRLFDPFFTTKGPGQGTGLGLAVVYGIVERHHGAISVYSDVGKGTVFHLYFPLAECPVVAPAPKPVDAVPGNGERILYVDDDESLVFMMSRMLPRLNYRVEGIDDPRLALKTFRDEPDAFDLVITDMSMPGMDGPALVKELRAIRPDLPIVMVTGYIRDSDLEEARSLGVNALILKPNTAQEMSADLHRILTEIRESKSP